MSTFVKTQRVAMSAAHVTGAAAMRRERRLRSVLQLERQTAAMELAAALHHSRAWDVRRNTGTGGSEPKGGSAQRGALRATAPFGSTSEGALRPWMEHVTDRERTHQGAFHVDASGIINASHLH